MGGFEDHFFESHSAFYNCTSRKMVSVQGSEYEPSRNFKLGQHNSEKKYKLCEIFAKPTKNASSAEAPFSSLETVSCKYTNNKNITNEPHFTNPRKSFFFRSFFKFRGKTTKKYFCKKKILLRWACILSLEQAPFCETRKVSSNFKTDSGFQKSDPQNGHVLCTSWKLAESSQITSGVKHSWKFQLIITRPIMVQLTRYFDQ